MELTTKDLFKERMTIRKSDPQRATVLGLLIDTVQKATKGIGKEETPADIGIAAKKMYNETEATILEYKKGNGDTAELESELKILSEFLPKSLPPEQMEAEVKKVLASLDPADRVMKNIMPKLKAVEGMDMKEAKALVEKLLQA